jgi:hypothetical protein
MKNYSAQNHSVKASSRGKKFFSKIKTKEHNLDRLFLFNLFVILRLATHVAQS